MGFSSRYRQSCGHCHGRQSRLIRHPWTSQRKSSPESQATLQVPVATVSGCLNGKQFMYLGSHVDDLYPSQCGIVRDGRTDR